MTQRTKCRVYLDTSVISYLEQSDAPREMRITQRLWEQVKAGKYDVYLSNVVIEEIADCTDERKRNLLKKHLGEIQYTEIKIDKRIRALAQHFIDVGILKPRNAEDSLHIAVTILCDCDIIVSWNFKHIVNEKTVCGIKRVTTEQGYKDILIYAPSALLAQGEDHD